MRRRRGRAVDLLGRLAVVALAVAVDLVFWTGDRTLRGGGALPAAVVPVLLVLVHSSLLVRGRSPRAVLALELVVAAAASLLVPQLQPVAGLLVALHAVAAHRAPRESVWWLVALVVPLGVHSWTTATAGDGPPTSGFALLLAVWLLIAAAVWGVGRLSWSSARRAWRLRELQAAEAAEAVADERARLARELHDIVSHAVTGMLLQAAGAQALLRPDDERLRASLGVIEATGVQAMAELHRMLGLLHPDGTPASAVPGPGLADLERLVALARSAGRDVRLEQVGEPGALDPSVEAAAYRVVQEGLTNSAKHAGPAATVVVVLRWADGDLEVVVTDRRRGEALAPEHRDRLSGGHGLRGLTERVTLIGGHLDTGSTADGFALTAVLPRPRVPVDRAGAPVP